MSILDYKENDEHRNTFVFIPSQWHVPKNMIGSTKTLHIGIELTRLEGKYRHFLRSSQ